MSHPHEPAAGGPVLIVEVTDGIDPSVILERLVISPVIERAGQVAAYVAAAPEDRPAIEAAAIAYIEALQGG